MHKQNNETMKNIFKLFFRCLRKNEADKKKINNFFEKLFV